MQQEEKAADEKAGDAEEDDEKKPPARQNAVLRRYFRQQYIAFAGDGVYLNRTFMERYVDRQIDHLLEQTERRLTELERNADLGCETWRDWAEAPGDRRSREAFKRALKDLEDAADSLGDKLAGIFRGMSYKAVVPPLPHEGAPEAVRDTLKGLKAETLEVRTAVTEYLFEPSHTVKLETLSGDDILARLYRLKKTAEGLRKSL